MNIKTLHDLTKSMIEQGYGDNDVAIDFATFEESDNGTILVCESADGRDVQGADDSGPVGGDFHMLVLSGSITWHKHGDPIK